MSDGITEMLQVIKSHSHVTPNPVQIAKVINVDRFEDIVTNVNIVFNGTPIDSDNMYINESILSDLNKDDLVTVQKSTDSQTYLVMNRMVRV